MELNLSSELKSSTGFFGKGRKENFLRKLQSLCGVVPLGIFLCFHMLVNYSAVDGPAEYNMVGYIVSQLMPYKVFLETFVIFLPLTFHAIYGMVIAYRSSINVGQYNYYRNWRYAFQRITGIVAFIFVAWHIYSTKITIDILGIYPSFELVHDIMIVPFQGFFFFIGVLCCIYHFCNGLWTFLITWGVTITPRSQAISQIILTAFFIAFAIFGSIAVFAFLV